MIEGAWVNGSTYSPGKRHYYAGGVARQDLGTEVKVRNGLEYVYHRWQDKTIGQALCGHHQMVETGYKVTSGKWHSTYGGLSSKEKVNLLQRNLCSYCLKRYIDGRPALREAVQAIKELRVES